MIRSPSGSPAWRRVRSSSLGPTASSPNTGPWRSASAAGLATRGRAGARSLVDR
jgi:hypothetical protein